MESWDTGIIVQSGFHEVHGFVSNNGAVVLKIFWFLFRRRSSQSSSLRYSKNELVNNFGSWTQVSSSFFCRYRYTGCCRCGYCGWRSPSSMITISSKPFKTGLRSIWTTCTDFNASLKRFIFSQLIPDLRWFHGLIFMRSRSTYGIPVSRLKSKFEHQILVFSFIAAPRIFAINQACFFK